MVAVSPTGTKFRSDAVRFGARMEDELTAFCRRRVLLADGERHERLSSGPGKLYCASRGRKLGQRLWRGCAGSNHPFIPCEA